MKNDDIILLQLLNKVFDRGTKEQIIVNYIKSKNLQNVTKWQCFSDYCFDDKEKSNDVVTFSIVPYIANYYLLEHHIKNIAQTDIKKTRKIKKEFIKFLNNYPLINFSFILNDRKSLFGETTDERQKSVLHHLNWAKKLYETWIKNEPEKRNDYLKQIKRIDSCIREAKRGKKINIYIDLFLISFLGAYVAHIILSDLNKIEVFGWFSDRDKIFEIADGIVINFFQNNLHGLLTEKQKSYQFGSSLATSNFDMFYDQFNKIPDYIAGTLSDYDINQNLISKDKFNTMLTDYMGDNTHNNYIFKIFKDKDNFNCSKIDIIKK